MCTAGANPRIELNELSPSLLLLNFSRLWQTMGSGDEKNADDFSFAVETRKQIHAYTLCSPSDVVFPNIEG